VTEIKPRKLWIYFVWKNLNYDAHVWVLGKRLDKSCAVNTRGEPDVDFHDIGWFVRLRKHNNHFKLAHPSG